jgi:protein dithiol oxidoreductase (disulfide-forming)
MKRRDFSLALAASSLAAGRAWAQNAFRAGKDYISLDKPVATEAGNGRIEVLEFFWYSCPHCNSFEPAFERWARAAPKDVVVRRVPVAFRPDFEPQQKLFYSLEAMNLLETVHPKVFQAIHVDKQVLNTEAAILGWIERQGVDKGRFAETYKSFGVATKVRRAVQLQNEYRIEGVPSLGVAGRYYIDGTLAGSMERALKVADALIAQTRGR